MYIDISGFFENLSRCSSFIKIGQDLWLLYMKTYVHLWYYLGEFFLEGEMFQRKFAEKVEMHFMLCAVSSENRTVY